MNWDQVQLDAKAKGTLVFAMDQAQTPVMTQPGPWGTAFDGYCIGLAAQWASYCYAKQTYPVDANKVCENPPWKSTLSQTLGDKTKAVVWSDRWIAACEPFQMVLSKGLRAHQAKAPTAAFLHAVVIKAYGCYGVTLERADIAHAICLRHAPDNRMHLFDANYGHFMVRDHTQLKPFLAWYLKATGYETQYTAGTGIVGLRPPINAK